MAMNFRCRSCQAVFQHQEGAPGATIRCPKCRAEFTRQVARAAPPEEPSARGSGPRPTRMRRKKRKLTAAPPLWAVLAGSALMAVLVGGGIVWFVASRPKPRDEPAADNPRRPGPPLFAPAEPAALAAVPWKARPDPAAAARAAVAADFNLISLGRAEFAALGGPFVADVPQTFRLPIRVYDLHTGKPVGRLPKTPLELPRQRVFGNDLLVLSPDGQTLIGSTGKPGQLAVWKLGTDAPAGTLAASPTLVFADFIAGPDVFVTVSSGPQPFAQVWNVTKSERLRIINLPALPRLPPAPRGVERSIRAAISPGRKFLAAAGPRQVSLHQLADGTAAGVISFADDQGMQVCRSLQFSPDGDELLGVFQREDKQSGRNPRLRAWKLADGSPTTDVELADIDVSQPLLLGPEPDAVLLGRQVIDRQTGLWVSEYKLAPTRWLADGRLLGPQSWNPPKPPPPGDPKWEEAQKAPPQVRAALGGEEEVMQVNQWWLQYRFGPDPARVGAAAFNRETFARNVELARNAAAPRPAPQTADRSGAAVVAADPPPAWSVPADGAKPARAEPLSVPVSQPGIAFFLSGEEAGRAAVLTATYHRRPKSRVALTCTWYDLRAGKPAEGPHELWPWVDGLVDPAKKQPLPRLQQLGLTSLFIAAVDGPGTQLALIDVGTPARVDVWDETGKRLASFLPADQDTAVEWVGWAPDGRLLTLAGGGLSGWDVPACKAAFEVRGGYLGSAAMSPNRNWAALPAKGHLDVIDTATGKLLGRLAAGTAAAAPWVGLAVAPDGNRLGGIHMAGERWTLRTWDLATGRPLDTFPLPAGTPMLGQALHWYSPRQLLLGGTDLIDLDRRLTVCRVEGVAGGLVAADSPDGRLWHLADKATRVLAAVPLPVPGIKVPEPVFGPTVGLALEVDCGDFTKETKAALGERLTAEGFKPGKAGWRLLVQASVSDTREKMTFGPLDKKGVAIPAVTGSARLLSPEGETVWQIGLHGAFPRKGSKYYTETKREGTEFYGTATEFYDFRGKDARTAMVEEGWENLLAGVKAFRMPHGFTKAEAEFKPLPVSVRP